MRYIAYLTSLNNPNLPNGFITTHFETDQPTLDGYLVTTIDAFNSLYSNNVALLRTFEATNGIVPASSTPTAPSVQQAVQVDMSKATVTTPQPDNQALFNQFLAWKAAQGNSS